jgi:hypothetical protein
MRFHKDSKLQATEEDMTIFASLIAAVLFVVIVVMTAFVQGFVISQLWQWYVVPMMNVPPMSILGAWGISLMAPCIFESSRFHPKNLLAACVVALVFGWLGTWFL